MREAVMRVSRIGRVLGPSGGRMLQVSAAMLTAAGLLGAVPPAAASAHALDWTKQAPASSPPARYDAAMAYDAATKTVVLFGGDDGKSHNFGDTWTWNGSTWTKQAPAAHPAARYGAAMAYDAATKTVVLF